MELAHSRQAMQAGGEAAAAEARRTAKREAEEAAQANLAKARQQVKSYMCSLYPRERKGRGVCNTRWRKNK
jgi:hypothetical protein